MTPVETVRSFLDCWAKGTESICQSFHDYLAADAVWENIGLSKTIGPAEAEAAFRAFEPIKTCQRIDIDHIAIAAQGGVVLNERVDYLVDFNGEIAMTVRVVGVFNVVDGRIAQWRDYFDTVPFAR
jgi:limonene-1,2-epoxide hydrolase